MTVGDRVKYPRYWDGSHPDEFYYGIIDEIKDDRAVVIIKYQDRIYRPTLALNSLIPHAPATSTPSSTTNP